MKSQISLKLRANNQITLTHGSWRKKELPVSQSLQNDLDKILVHEWQEKKDEIIGDRLFYERQAQNRKTAQKTPLDIIQKSQRSKKPLLCRIHKPKSFTKESGQKLRESGAAVDIACNGEARFCHEVTLTLPANTKEAFRALAAQSHYVINRLFQPIRRHYGNMCLWFFVWEYQKRGALHLHICVYHPDESEGLWISAQLIEQWHKILQDVSVLTDTDMFLTRKKDRCTIRANHQHHTAPINKAVGAYFSKYAGKQESKNNWYCQAYPVSRFWGSSMSVKEICKANSLDYNFDYQASEIEAENKFQSIIENIIEKLSIVGTSSYEFNISLSGSHRLNHYRNGRKILSHWDGKNIAEGTRYTFYFNQSELGKAIELITNECEYF